MAKEALNAEAASVLGVLTARTPCPAVESRTAGGGESGGVEVSLYLITDPPLVQVRPRPPITDQRFRHRKGKKANEPRPQ